MPGSSLSSLQGYPWCPSLRLSSWCVGQSLLRSGYTTQAVRERFLEQKTLPCVLLWLSNSLEFPSSLLLITLCSQLRWARPAAWLLESRCIIQALASYVQSDLLSEFNLSSKTQATHAVEGLGWLRPPTLVTQDARRELLSSACVCTHVNYRPGCRPVRAAFVM